MKNPQSCRSLSVIRESIKSYGQNGCTRAHDCARAGSCHRVALTDGRVTIEQVNSVPVYRLRGCLLPLLYLNQELKFVDGAKKTGAEESVAGNIVLLEAGDRELGLVVEKINDTEEVVVKPLRKQLKSVKPFVGSSIMGDGKVVLILCARSGPWGG